MYFDKSLMFLDGDSFDTTPEVVKLNNANADKGEPLKIQISGVGVTGITAVAVSSDDANATTLIDTIPCVAADVNNGFAFHLPRGCGTLITIGLTGITAGTVTAGIVFDSQSAM